ncbi:hypothetical protein WH218_06770 [Stenotrophomonas indicatrix]|uniref:hypothetical protein n=1 Tax=Stenotrophomonas indicatrix TaxID=2045451 RepID=UPI0015DEDC7D|nr:hypothetical protein [Stenotrophomonas indicatrix]MBA0098764.1 hypothetical protein [Stenotrophomonas indicatrix]
MLAFADLPEGQQRVFLETLNSYLFASPQRRRTYVRAWTRRMQAQGGQAAKQKRVGKG